MHRHNPTLASPITRPSSPCDLLCDRAPGAGVTKDGQEGARVEGQVTYNGEQLNAFNVRHTERVQSILIVMLGCLHFFGNQPQGQTACKRASAGAWSYISQESCVSRNLHPNHTGRSTIYFMYCRTAKCTADCTAVPHRCGVPRRTWTRWTTTWLS